MKTLTSQQLGQKEALFCKPVHLIEVERDHPDSGASFLYIGSWTKEYSLGGNTYVDRIAPGGLGDLHVSIKPGGGIAEVGDWHVVLDNLEASDLDGRFSDQLDEYFLENDEIRYLLVFRDGTETVADILTLYVGQIQDSPVTTRAFEIRSKDGTRSTIKSLPQEISDPVQFPNIPIDNVNKPLPWVFGDLNVEPFNTAGARPRLAPCVCVDGIDQQYTSGLLNKSYGQPYVFYRSARYYAKIVDYTITGAYFTVDSSARWTKIKPMRALATNDVSGWRSVVDGSTSTGAALVSGSNLDLQMRGSPKLGTVTAAEIRIEASGAYDYTVSKAGETDVTGSTSGAQSISLVSWDFDSNWDFERIEVKIDGTGAATINLVTLDITFVEHETGDQLAFPVFQAIVGYEDLAARYPDGGVINTSGLALTNPIDVILAFARDSRTGMRMPIAQVDTSNIAAERALIADWKFDFSLTKKIGTAELGAISEMGKVRMFRSFDAKWKLSVFDKTTLPVYHFSHGWNINARNPQAPADEQETTLRYYQSPLSEVYNEFILHYGWDEALGEYTAIEVASPHYRASGTCTLDLSAGTLTDTSGQFVTIGIQVGYKLFVVRDQLYVVDAVASETVLEISAVEDGGIITDGHSDSYYIGPNFDYRCFRSIQKYKTTQTRTIECRVIQDEDTAKALIDHLVEYWAERRGMVQFRTSLNAVDLETTDFIIVDHPDIPPRKRPALLGTLDAGVSDSGTALSLEDAGALLAREDDVLVLKAGDHSKQYREVVVATGIDEVNEEIDVDRAQVGTQARSWLAGDEVWRAITKFEVVDLGYLGNDGEIEITARETPRYYSPVAHYAPEGTPDWEDATPGQRARYAYYCHPNGEIVWLDPDTDLTRYASES